jgi:hypothetical protein
MAATGVDRRAADGRREGGGVAAVRAGLLVGLAALALAGCSSGGDAAPPPVKLDDLNLKPYADKPCTLLNADQLSEYGIDKPGTPEQTTCWLNPSDPAKTHYAVSVSIGSPDPAKQPLKIAGYPADESGPGVPGTKLKSCIVRVVVAPKQQVVVGSNGADSCHSAEMVATSAIATIKRNSP